MLSIIVALPGQASFPRQCMESLLTQTYADWEVLVFPYGALPQWEYPDDDRVRISSKTEASLTDALNEGICQAKGEYILFLDPDTWLDEDALAVWMELVQEDDLDLLRFGCIREYRTRNMVAKLPFVSQEVCRGEAVKTICRQTVGLIESELAYTERINGLSMANFCIYRKSVMDEHGLRFENVADIKLFSDCLFNIAYLMKANSFRYLEAALCHCETPQSYGLSPVYRESYLDRQCQFFQKLRALAEENEDPSFLEAYHNRVIFSTLDICLNVLKSGKDKKAQYKEFKLLRNSTEHRLAYKTLQLGKLPSAWKMYYFFAKYGLTRRLFAMTKTIRAYQ